MGIVVIDWRNFDGFFSTGIPKSILLPSFAITTLVLFAVLLCIKGNKIKYALWTVLIEYLFIVVCSTIICRGTQSFEYARLELTPFWTYKAVYDNMPGVSVWDIVLNVVLFIPLGFLIKLLFPSLSLLKIIFIAAFCSLFIETNQYVFEKGIAQIDDVMHNILGGVLGWIIARAIIGLKRKLKIVRD